MSDSEKIRILLDQGLTAYGLGNREAALEAWNTVLAMDPGNTKAKEYIRFVEENWGPKQERLSGPEQPYRPDEGSGEISAPDVVPVEAETPEPSPPPAEPEDHGDFEKDAFTPPAKPILQGDQWGDLYDFGKREPTAKELPEAPESPAPEPEPIQQKELSPDQEKIKPLAGDWSRVLTPEEQAQQQQQESASTLPPHPGDIEEIEIVEEQPEEELQEVEPEPLAPEPPVQPEPIPPAADDNLVRDELAPTKKYEAVPTMVRPPEEAVPAQAVPPEQEPQPEPPPVEEKVARDSFDRFPEDPAPQAEQAEAPQPAPNPEPLEPAPQAPEPLAPEPGMAFYQTPRPETTPPLGSPILEQNSADLLDLVGGGGPEGAAPVPGISAVSEVDSLMKGARDMLELDDFSGAIELLDKVLELEAGHSEARQMREDSERKLLAMLSSKLGDLNRTPRVRMSQDEIIWLNLDNRAGFVLSLVDGSLSLDEIISICGLPQLEGMRILVQLLQEKVIEIS
jgi:hypothetical protein